MITIDFPSRVIFIPKADLTLLQTNPVEIRELNLNTFRLALKNLEDDDEGMAWPTTHNHVAPISVGGVQLARIVELINDYTVTFEDGQYAVNLVGANSNVADRVNVNQVSVRASNSAGLIQSREIEHASFDAAVHIDTALGTVGTAYPTGTPRQPTSNIDDAILIADVRGLDNFHLRSTMSLSAGHTFQGKHFVGERRGVALVGAGASFAGCHFTELILTGDLSTLGVGIHRCALADATISDAYVEQTALSGTIAVVGAGPTWILQCIDADALDTFPVLDLAAFTGDLFIRAYYGSLRIINVTEPIRVKFDTTGGKLVLDASVTNGTFLVRGTGQCENSSTGAAVVDATDLVTNASIANKVHTDPRALTVQKFGTLK